MSFHKFCRPALPISLLALAVSLGSGCASPGTARSWIPTGHPIEDGKQAIANGPAKDRVMWQCRTALEFMRRGRFDDAKALLDDALLTIASSSAGDLQAKKSRSLFSSESGKVFRGEPYERVMAYYYRGIIYWIDGEPDNARACFRSGQIIDADTESREYASDFALLDYLDGLATVKLAGDGSGAFQRAQALRSPEMLPAYDSNANTLVFIEFGHGPTKHATGEYAQELRFRGGSSAAESVLVTVADRTIELRSVDNLTFQATTRGGRVMDHILGNKAVFKSGSDAIGNMALISGAVVAGNRKTQEAGLGLLAFGLASKIVSAATTPSADTRCWNNLPQHLTFTALHLAPGQHTATIEFLDSNNQPVPSLRKTATINVSPQRDTVVFVSDQSHTTGTL